MDYKGNAWIIRGNLLKLKRILYNDSLHGGQFGSELMIDPTNLEVLGWLLVIVMPIIATLATMEDNND